MADSKTPPSSEPPPTSMKSKLLGDDDDQIDISQLPEMSVEDVDAFLEEEAPDFFKEVSSMGADKTLSLKQIIVDDADVAIHAEVDLWKSYTGPLKILFLLMPFMPRVTLRFKNWKLRATGWLQAYWIRARNFAYYVWKDGRASAMSKTKLTLAKLRSGLAQSLTTFKKISFKARLILLSSALLLLLSVGVVYQSLTKGLLPSEKEMFLTGFTNHATESFEYDPSAANEQESYIDNSRAAQNLLLTRKIVVNLKPSAGSGENPMGAFEFFIEGMSSDVVIEIKDREPMMRDLMQGVIQGMTYDELDTEAGKKDLSARLQKEISRVLTTGSVKNVRIKSFVIKP